MVDGTKKEARVAIEERRAQQAALVQQLLMAAINEKRAILGDEKVDGERTETRGPCECGFRHWFEGREVDFVYPVETPMGVKILGYSLTGISYLSLLLPSLKFDRDTLIILKQ